MYYQLWVPAVLEGDAGAAARRPSQRATAGDRATLGRSERRRKATLEPAKGRHVGAVPQRSGQV